MRKLKSFLKHVKRLLLQNIGLAVLVISFATLYATGIIIYRTEHLAHYSPVLFVMAFSLIGIISGATLFISSYIRDKKNTNEKLSKLADERSQIESKIEQGESRNVQEIIKLNLNQLDEYYTINKSQSKRSYNLSIIMIIVGFLFLVVTVVMFLVDSEIYTISVIIGLAGLIAKFIGLTSLYLFKESSKHSNEFIKRLAYLQKIMLAVDLTEKISEDRKYDQIANIIDGLVNPDKSN